ncbi:MAG TPA: hypothetical protein DCZ49_05965 [Hyphomonadaceae bacterium]|nr:hypothetical protein [Hyphomonadaceae bacterium]
MIAGAALASPGVSLAAVKSKDKDDEETDAGESARSVDVLGIAFPVVRNKKIVNYAFMNLRYVVASGKDHWKLRENAHILRDAIIIAFHRTHFVDPNTQELESDSAMAALWSALDATGLRQMVERIDHSQLEFQT